MAGLMNNIKVGRYFYLSEFECSHCGVVKIHPDLITLLDLLRMKLGAQIMVNSGYRCKRHNEAVGGHPNSHHMEGRAVDITTTPEAWLDLVQLWKQWSFLALSWYVQDDKKFIHIAI